MQQTETCKLNLIETSDPFSPDALNENARTLDAQLARVDAAAAAEKARVDAALAAKAEKTALTAEETARKAEDARLVSEIARVDGVLNGRVRFASGQYIGDGVIFSSAKPKRLVFDFKPMLVVVVDSEHSRYGGYLWTRGRNGGVAYVSENGSTTSYVTLSWEDRAVAWFSLNTNGGVYHLNQEGTPYNYFVIGVAN